MAEITRTLGDWIKSLLEYNLNAVIPFIFNHERVGRDGKEG